MAKRQLKPVLPAASFVTGNHIDTGAATWGVDRHDLTATASAGFARRGLFNRLQDLLRHATAPSIRHSMPGTAAILSDQFLRHIAIAFRNGLLTLGLAPCSFLLRAGGFRFPEIGVGERVNTCRRGRC